MRAVTVVDYSPYVRIGATVHRRDAIQIEFTIEQYASLVSHTWIAQIRKGNGVKMLDLTVSPTLTTVAALNDSVKVTLSATKAQNTLRAGVYAIDAQDSTTGTTWMTGTITIDSDWAN